MQDLFVLAADKNMQFALKGALNRNQAIGIRRIEYTITTHAQRDSGAMTSGPEILALKKMDFVHALLVLDYEGSGSTQSALELETELDSRMHNHWGTNAKAIVIEPELETWVWGSDNAVKQAIEWPSNQSIRKWLLNDGFEFEDNNKPKRPKEAFQAVLRNARQPRSSMLYEILASRLSLERCTDNAFLRLRNQLRDWFRI